MSFKVQPLPNAKVGVQVTELDLSQPISDADQKALYDLWVDKGIILFKGLGHNAEEHLRLSKVFGDLRPHEVRHLRGESDHPEFMVLASEEFVKLGTYYRDENPDEVVAGIIPWHSDQIFTVQPNHGAMLRVVDIPKKGGQTGWIDTIAAYDALSDEMKARIENLEVEYKLCRDFLEAPYGRDPSIHAVEVIGAKDFDEFPAVAHPLVLKHPISGKKVLNVSPLHLVRIVGMDAKESDALLKELVEHVTSSEFSYIHSWEPNDMMLWDNWRTLHAAIGYPASEKRRGLRTNIYGDSVMGRVLEQAS